MDDQTLETLYSDQIVNEQTIWVDSNCETGALGIALEQAERNCDVMDESNASNDIPQETCSDEEHTPPILQKINHLSNRVQILKEEHTVLCNEVKGIVADSFPGSEVFNALQGLSTQHDLLKKKYHEECETLKKKYLEECSERKRLYNEVIELKGNIRVFCRCRPLNQDDIATGSSSIVEFDSSHDNELQIICSDSSRKQFKFDHVFRPEDNQEAVFAQTSPIVTSVLDGFNVCIFAYGQTGTGKTFTMEGTTESRGVNYRTLEQLFRISSERSSIIRHEVFVSMLEVYNEKIRDLLIENSNQPAKKLEIKQAADGTQEVPGLVEARVYGTEEVWELLKSGSRVRSVGSTSANELSSRSHCLLRVAVKGENLITGQRTKSHLWLVDLAGSERVGKIEVEGERLKESQFINKSLSALGDVISALASKTTHVPYRNSKLTHMLQSSLGGDCKTIMFVQISPSATDFGETLCSLNFATRVRGIEHAPARKQADLTELFKYKQMAEKAKHDEKETKMLQDSVQSLQLRLAAREHISRSLQEKVRDLENQLAEERKIRLKQETRAFSAAAPMNQTQKTISEKKPPLGPSKLRLPLQRITNFLPHPSPIPPHKTKASNYILPVSANDKENIPKTLLRTRRGSFVVRPSGPKPNPVLQPRRRASIATFFPEPSSNMKTPLSGSSFRLKNDRHRQSFGWDPQNVTTTALNGSSVQLKNDNRVMGRQSFGWDPQNMTTPLKGSSIRLKSDNRVMGRQSFVWDPQRVLRASRMYSPLRKVKEDNTGAVEATPIASRSSKFIGSPPTQAGSWKPKHPTVVALQRKTVVWSPLKLRGFKNKRKSLLPS